MYPIPDSHGQTGGVSISGTTGPVAGDIIGHDKIENKTVNNLTFINDGDLERSESLEKTVRKKDKHLIAALLLGAIGLAVSVLKESPRLAGAITNLFGG